MWTPARGLFFELKAILADRMRAARSTINRWDEFITRFCRINLDRKSSVLEPLEWERLAMEYLEHAE